MILHLDMDAFFASVEQLDNPELRGLPVIIGGRERGVVATASYEARKYGVHSAMPMAVAKRLCPNGIFMRGNGKRYSQISGQIMACLHEFSPVVQAASIDEAYIDLHHLGTQPGQTACSIKTRIFQVTGGLTCSIGIAPVKFLAKICSDINKPDGIFILMPSEVDDFLSSMPIERIPGVGPSMTRSLRNFGIRTVGELKELGLDFLMMRYGKWGRELYDRARGLDSRPVHPNLPAKSESAECTFAVDITDRTILRNALLCHAERVASRLRKNHLAGRTITLKLKFSDFRIITRALTLEERVSSTDPIFGAACELLANERLNRPVRLIGLGVSGFDFRPVRSRLPGLDGVIENRRSSRLDRAVDAITARFGKGMLTRASAMGYDKKTNHNFGSRDK